MTDGLHLRGFKRHLYEGGIRAPFMARWPGVTKPGTSARFCGHVDFLAAAHDLAGVSASSEADGISIAPSLLYPPHPAKRESLYWETHKGPAPFQQAVRMRQWKDCRTALKAWLELYVLANDPTEKDNVAAAYPDVVKRIEFIMTCACVRNPNWETVEHVGDRLPRIETMKSKKQKR